MTLVSINVCVRDGVFWVDECLNALVNQTHRPLEIILVDDGSSDGTTMKVEEWGKHELVKSISTSPEGLSAARMSALDASKGTWVAITDIDVRPEPDWVEKMLEQLTTSEENVYAVTGRTRFGRADDVVSQVRSIEVETKYQNRSRMTSLANGPCSMFLREKLLSIGGFNPEWYHAEDMEVSLRLIAKGGSIIYAPNAVVRHVPEVESSRFLAKRRRDARAHMRIIRNFPRTKRKGPGLDFIGSSTVVLMVFPLWIMALISGIPFLFSYLTQDDWSWEMAKARWQTQLLLATGALMILHEFILWRGPLGVVNRGAIKQGKWSLLTVFKVRNLTLRWSFALWQGLFLGLTDALRGLNGHRKLFGKKSE
ncbi:MAG TPA: glycosyltransferase family 2 protein [Candidatus Poseidoniales archaeon]|nr:MAG TPA: glycosyltransferase family 2 protein [Candidatus Poseidoniales archaeon]